MAGVDVPIDVLDRHAVGEAAAQTIAAFELIEPRLERRGGKAPIIVRGSRHGEHSGEYTSEDRSHRQYP
jgi:hypothetical protein